MDVLYGKINLIERCSPWGIIYENRLYRRWDYLIGADLICLYTYSQSYIVGNNINYSTSNGRTLGWNLSSNIGLIRKLNKGKFYIYESENDNSGISKPKWRWSVWRDWSYKGANLV